MRDRRPLKIQPCALRMIEMTDQRGQRHLIGRLHLIPGRRGGRYPHCNSLLVDSGERAVIDPGSDRRELSRLHEEGTGRVLLSHFHSDHLRDLREFPGAEVMVHELEKPAVESWEGMRPLVWFPEETLDKTWMRRKDREVGGWGWPVSATFRDGDEIEIGGVICRVIHAPGHTPGHCAFWFPAEELLFLADIDLTEFGPWYGNAGSGVDDFLASIELIKRFKPRLAVTGHEAGVIEDGLADRLEAYAGIIHDRHRRMLEFLARPRSLDEIVARAFIYGEFYSRDNSLHDPEYRMVRHHLAYALSRGEAVIEDGLYRARGR